MSDPENRVHTGPWQPAEAKAPPPDAIPKQVGRYRVVRLLGQGGFGQVYLAHDDQLQRPVAVKVPHRRLVSRPEDADAYLAEARTVANLDHPHIVPVFDVGRTEDCPCYVVSKYIDGTDLASRLKQSRLSLHETVVLAATVAEALHHAHKQGLVHRDIKPSNILLDKSGRPFVADFGLALREQDIGKGPRYAGTPAYMSPEQARGEGHRVDGRSDIFSLGVVFYELLVGRQPFRADSQADLLEQITSFEPRPPRQYDDSIPKELDRICLKALSKRASERYSTAKDMADDLRHFLAEQPGPMTKAIGSPASTPVVPLPSTVGWPSTPVTPTSDSQPVKIVPKGLRSFDAHDADFFLELLPGPRDRDGLPDSIRFWKTRIEESDLDDTFTVGLIYGPSGCGKSSLVKAGLLPRLSDDVIAVYVEATAEETEARLLSGLRKRCPALSGNLSLKATLAALRRGQEIPPGKKVLIVLDQFEQWLHAKKEEENTELVQALRQCDGGRVQCVVMVRDDFWMAVTRFLTGLEIELLQGRNCAAADLFDLDHARKVLAAFGRAFGKLPDSSGETTSDQKEFLNRAGSGLAQEGKVICVRLALFAEMMKGKPWTPATLKEVGGTEGVGVSFLEETFAASTAPPQHRLHQKAAQAVLKALLPESGTDIKGHMRSHAELLAASGYTAQAKNFDALLRILDGEIRLITPTDPEGKEGGESPSQVQTGQKYYQLTHDYLVHSLREWLTRKQKETPRGRAELLLADRAAVWNARPENRQLPSLLQWFQITWLTLKKNWTPPQRKMMGRASRHHAVRGLALGLLLAVATVTGLVIREQVVEQHKATEAAGLVAAVLNADTAQVPTIIGEMAEYRKWANPLLREENDKAATNSRQKLHASLALLPVDSGQVAYLFDRLLDAAPLEVPVIRDALAPYKDSLLDKLTTEIDKKLPPEIPSSDDRREKLAKRQANAAAALLKMNQPAKAWPVLKHTPPDPRARSYLIHRLYPLGVDSGAIVQRLDEEPDVTIRRALLLSLGEYDEKLLSPEARKALLPKLQVMYRNDADPGLHAASEWLLRTWQEEAWLRQANDGWAKDKEQRAKRLQGIQQLVTKDKEKAPPQWYVNGQGQTLVVIPGPVEFVMGSPTTEKGRGDDEIQHKKRIGRTFALAAKPVTVEQYKQFDKGYQIPAVYTRTADLPVVGTSWYQAAAYCNWLSRREGIDEDQWCYETDATGKVTGLKKQYLSLTGYRLPTEAEVEFATRAGAVTSRYYGETDELLPRYAWYLKNSEFKTWPVGRLKPNDLGLFDAQGNVYTWCQERYQGYPTGKGDRVFEDKEDILSINNTVSRVVRGGSFNYQASGVRSAGRGNTVPANRFNYTGFRPARTFTP